MANAGGAWDNAKKLVEVDLREKGTALHSATVVGDTVGDPFKDTTSVALNPIIKFSTLFGLLAVEIAVNMKLAAKAAGSFDYTVFIGFAFLAVALIFVYRSFYSMRITTGSMKNEKVGIQSENRRNGCGGAHGRGKPGLYIKLIYKYISHLFVMNFICSEQSGEKYFIFIPAIIQSMDCYICFFLK